MEREFVPYEQGLELKELGFDRLCLGSRFTNDIALPTYHQAFDWFLEKHGYHISIARRYFGYNNETAEFNYFIYPPNSDESFDDNLLDEYDTIYDARLAGLINLIRIIKIK
jgi:hypothetical protein